jgi:hypothetical protein
MLMRKIRLTEDGPTMLRRSIGLLCLVVLVAAGCAHKAVAPANSQSMHQESRRNYFVMGSAGNLALAGSRYLAVRHKLATVVAGSELPKALEAVTAFCGTIQCEVVSSSITSQTEESLPSGSLSLRVNPGDVNKLIAFVGKQGKVAQHTTETEDKTAIVVDTDAKIKNLTEFRDTLRKMLARPAVSVADIVQIQEKLAEVQGQLDSEAAQRKILANETEKVAVEVEFRAERTTASISAFRPIAEALRESAAVLSESIASLITAIVAIIPWLIVIVPGGWLLLRAWRRRKKEKAVGV